MLARLAVQASQATVYVGQEGGGQVGIAENGDVEAAR